MTTITMHHACTTCMAMKCSTAKQHILIIGISSPNYVSLLHVGNVALSWAERAALVLPGTALCPPPVPLERGAILYKVMTYLCIAVLHSMCVCTRVYLPDMKVPRVITLM